MALLGLTTRCAIGVLSAEIGTFSREQDGWRNSSTRRGSAAKGGAGTQWVFGRWTGGAGEMA